MAKLYIKKHKDSKIHDGNPWIYRSDIDKIIGDFENGDIVKVYSQKERFLGTGYYNPDSQISLRMLTHSAEEINREFLVRRVKAAWEYRKLVADINSCRVIFAESDFLPGLIVDKFANILVVQILTLGMEKFKTTIFEVLNEIIKPDGIFERSDVAIRELEGLEQNKGFIGKPFDTLVEMQENGVKFLVDIENGQKTGFFLDQKENRAAIKPFVHNSKVLDCFTHTGSFALHAGSYGATSVLGIDISAHAVESAQKNALINQLENVCTFQVGNTFDILREYYDSKNRFDTIILDPPAFTKSKDTIESAVKGYKEINLRAMKIIEDGGFLITCSCSHHISPDLFMDILFNAAIDAKKNVRIIEQRSQSKDHPYLLALPETEYLKCFILQICNR